MGISNMRKTISLLILLMVLSATANAGEFSFDFDWSNLKQCTSGNPNTVSNPTFTLNEVPPGTKWIYFKLVDLNVPSYRHGGGWIEFTGQSTVQPGAFKYKSPCPPRGRHKYEWTATAKPEKKYSSSTIDEAKMARLYP